MVRGSGRGARRANRRGARHANLRDVARGNRPLVGKADANRLHGSRAGNLLPANAAAGRLVEAGAVLVADRHLLWRA